MKKVLYVDCCIRGNESRTKKIADEFINNLKGYELDYLNLMEEDLKPLYGKFFEDRQILLENNERNHERFRYAHQYANADMVVIAAPFWDLNFPALLKIYIENISVDGITFKSTAEGLKGLCKADKLVFITSRGGIFKEGDEMECALPYLRAFLPYYGFKELRYIAANGMDIQGFDSKGSLEKAINEAQLLAKELSLTLDN
ncbi:MAG: NAD(P)H-dependent oxidoreductase [Erysipelotrichaceae bacterium]|nr:NAD(P)H-dependent oxidoreductase [Erysipelotrichaceae bacterium]